MAMKNLLKISKYTNFGKCLSFVVYLLLSNLATTSSVCDKSRKVFTGVTFGEISHGQNSNYSQDSHCEWMIKAENNNQFITLKFLSLKTECSYDYIFVYDGNSYNSRLIGSYSGQTEPEDITASSGSMLILLYSDTNYVLDGFTAEFSIISCLNNCSDHGICINHSCLCKGDWIGKDCSEKACVCGAEENRGVCSKDRCECRDGFAGKSCTLRKENPEPSQWHWVTNSSRSLRKRAAHTAIYHEKSDSIFVFGGYDLNNVIGSLEIFDFSTSNWEDEDGNIITSSDHDESISKSVLKDVLLDGDREHKSNLGIVDQFWFKAALLSHIQTSPEEVSTQKFSRNLTKPLARYGHAACTINEDSFIIYGGKLASGELSNELWLYNISSSNWILKATQSRFTPPKLTRHSLTFVNSNGFVYLFGGAEESGEFSSRMFRIKLDDDEQWEEVFPRGGKSFDHRVVAHTTNFHPETNILIVYGGIIASAARLSKLSDKIFAFSIDDQFWTEIHYPKSVLREMSVPRERAFHTATIAGNYLIVFGGYSHRHNKEEICYDNQMYLYHLGCHAWINQEALGANRSHYPKKQGVFAHAATLRGSNTLLIVGGYHGNVNNDFLAFTLPDIMNPKKNLTENEKCTDYKSSTECISNPQCGWCSSDATCYGRTLSLCFTNLQTTRCPGICSALRDCQSCLVHGNIEFGDDTATSIANKLPIGKCTWCVQNMKCYQKNDYEPCGESDSVENIGYQWWGRNGIEIKEKSLCTKYDKPPGLTFTKHFYPFDWNQPDFVSLVNSTLVDFSGALITSQAEPPQNGQVIARLRGFLRLPLQENQKDLLKVCGSYAQIVLKTISGDKTNVATNFTADQYQCINSIYDTQTMLIDLQARRKLSNQITQQHYQSKVGLQNNATKTFTFEFLEPFSQGNCREYNNCLQCLSDNSCGWCDLKNSCVSRDVNETSECSIENQGDVIWRYLTIKANQCVNCSNFISCDTCTESRNCEWWSDETKCIRAGRSPAGVKDVALCPSPCHARTNCSSCLNEKGRCVWCEDQNACFSFSVYISEYQFGICREWIDQSSPETAKSIEHHQCKSCSQLRNCSACLRNLGCGWCFFKDNPIEGACIQGDFNSSMIECEEVLNTTEPTLYNYESCPDVDECALGIHDCHSNAECTNTHGSYFCKCEKGFIGDGKHRCDRTCIETCHHGRCSNYPDFNCICDLGWTGSDCSINCGCNNHSTCRDGVGTCDECHDYTEGSRCESCVVGSYGNATTIGCFPCNCNGHGDETKGQCHSATGKCFCLDHTEGMNCEICTKEYYGEPRNGGQCYLQCHSRSVLQGLRSQGIGSFEGFDATTECLWILKLNDSLRNGSLIQLEIKEDINVTCYNNAIFVYNNIPEFSKNMMRKKLSHVICRESSFPKTIEESKTGQMTIYYQRSMKNEGFNAVISVLSCQLGSCVSPHICDSKNHCVCPMGTRGVNCEIEVCPFNCTANLLQGTCDSLNNRCSCNEGFGGEDCSRIIKLSSIVMTELFSTQIVTLHHLKKTLPRFGHTANADRRGFIWIFGGFSLTNGALNDIRQFDTKNHTWMQVTVDGSESKMPIGRYFHASEVSKQSIYTYGGLTHNQELLNDFWMFNIQDQRWMEIKAQNGPGFRSGHSLTLVKMDDKESLLLIGGYSNETISTGTLWEFSFNNSWKKMNVSGVGPAAIFGHSTVFHQTSQILYVFGGYQMMFDGEVKISRKLFSLSFQKEKQLWSWSVLPVFNELNRPEENLPRSRFLHSTLGFNQFMIVFGGESEPMNSSDYLNAYVYKCNSWIRLTENVDIIGQSLEKLIFAQAVAVDAESDNNNFYLVGGVDSTFTISKISMPSDICQLWSNSKLLCRLSRGCSFGTVTTNNTKTTFCFSSDQKENRKNEIASAFNHGLVCDEELISQRNCSSFDSCSECEASWPNEDSSNCQWCQGEQCEKSTNKCLSKASRSNETSQAISTCLNINCTAIDCDSCNIKTGCNWAKQLEKFSCLPIETIQKENLETPTECPKKCSTFNECYSCLSSSTFEGGFSNCVWSTKMSRCLSPAYKPLICSGGNCGLLLSQEDSDQCPLSCESHTMCSNCLKNAHCGWCSAADETDVSGDGVCVEGNLEQPISESEDVGSDQICKIKYEATKNKSANYPFSWSFLVCPSEDECINQHHTCNNRTEKCVDLVKGFKCECAEGYEESEDSQDCLPICPLGCIHGVCVDPGKCKCDFGYVGNNCSIQCLCSGHSDCEAPDKLDVCLSCKNNTIGEQCERCEKFFVGDPKNNGKCVSCLDYCNGHTDICVPEVLEGFRNMSKDELAAVVTEGAKSKAVCLSCAHNTDGARCETCNPGYFRGTTNLNDSCRKCQCNGHGDNCDPVTGEKCNCGDNSENDNTCPAKLDKNSIYHCWMSQCTKCKESYSGHPKNGHQCYKHITIDSKMCLDAKPLDECKSGDAIPLMGGKTVFFVIQPRFMNVDIRIILDITQGDVDFFMSSNDDSFVVLTNHTSGLHEILLDSKYQWIQEVDSDFDYSENLNVTPLVTSSKKSFDNVSIPHGFTDDRGAADCRSFGKFHVLDKVAHSLSSHITLGQCNTLLRVFGLKNRLVVTLPQNVHNLSGTRFFIALRAANHATVTGLLFFRQDQLHIDLFVFFSVFFSCFFLFLSACVVFWKMKQAADMRRARRRHVVEMLNMAQRPYSSVILDATVEKLSVESQTQKSSNKNKTTLNKKDIIIGPVAVETTANNAAAVATVFIRLPGQKRTAVCLGSSLIIQPKNNIFLNKPPPRISQQMV